MTDSQATNEPTNDDAQSAFLRRVAEETSALATLHEMESNLSNDLASLADELHQLKQEKTTEDHDQKIEACLQKIKDRVTKFEDHIGAYEIIQLRGPWSLNADVQNAVNKQNAEMKKLGQNIQAQENRLKLFFADGDENQRFDDAQGVSAKWLQQAHEAVSRVVNTVQYSLDHLMEYLTGAFSTESHLFESLVAHLDDHMERIRTEGAEDKQKVADISNEIKQSARIIADKMASPEMDNFLKKVGDRLEKAAELDSIEEKLGAQKEILNDIKDKQNDIEELKQGIVDLKSGIEKLTSRPVVDDALLIETHSKVDELVQLGKSPQPQLDAIHKGVMTMIETQDIHEENRNSLKQLAEGLEKFQSEEKRDFAEMKASFRDIDGQLKALKEESPAQYSKKLEDFNALLNEATNGIEENQTKLIEVEAYFEDLQKQPQLDPEWLREMEKMLHDIQNRPPLPDFDKTFKGFSQKLKELTEETPKGFQAVNSGLDEAKGELKDIAINLGQTNEQLGSVDKQLGSVDNHLSTIDQSVNAIDVNLGSATGELKAVKADTEGLKLDVEGIRGLLRDHSANIETEFSKIHQNLDEVKTRPALNSEFTDIHGQMGLITDAIGKYESTSILGHLKNLETQMHDNPVLNMNPEDIQKGFKGVTKLIEARPSVDQQPIMDELDSIKRQTAVANENLANLDEIAQDTHFLRNRPLLGPNELRDVVTPLHAKLDSLRLRLLTIEGTALTREYFDQRHPAAAIMEGRDRTKAILDTVQAMRNQVIEIGERPGFSAEPVNSLHRDVRRLQEEHKNNIESLAAKMGSVPQTVGAQVAGLKSEVKQDMNKFTGQLVQINERQAEANSGMKFVRNVSLGAALLSGATLFGVLGYLTFFGKEKHNEGSAKRMLAARGKRRVHARSWNRE